VLASDLLVAFLALATACHDGGGDQEAQQNDAGPSGRGGQCDAGECGVPNPTADASDEATGPSAGGLPWAGILDPSRAIDWRQVPSDVPSGAWSECVTAACATLTAAGTAATSAQINAAIASAPANTFVKLGAGTYNLSQCIEWAGHGHVALRGSGPSSTILKFSGSGCGGYSGSTFIHMQAASNSYDQSTGNLPGGSNSFTITGTAGTASGGPTGLGLYPSGATEITVSGVGSDAPHVGTLLFIDQADDTAPSSDWLQCASNAPGAACSENGNNNGRRIDGVNYEQVQAVHITNISGTTYTISPGLYASNMRASQHPGGWWNFSSNVCAECGLEDVTLDFYAASVTSSINIYDCDSCWITNSRVLNGGGRNDIYLVQSSHVTIRDDYFFQTAGSSSGGGYVIDVVETSDSVIENNIFDQVDNPQIFENGSGFIVGFNYSRNNKFTNPNWTIDTLPSHDSGSMMNLWEGNNYTQVSQDTQHGPSPAITFFRNNINGNMPVPNDKTAFTTPIEVQSYNHGINFIGNTLGMITCAGGTYAGRPADEASQCVGGTLTGPSWHAGYEASPGTSSMNCPNVIFMLGWPTGGCAASAGNLLSDPSVAATMMRWGNYDTFHGSVEWNAGEIPTTGGQYLKGNPVPATHTLPPSFYYRSKPAWYASPFGSPPFPPIGPDVSGGELAGLAGHAYRNPARLCYENATQDSVNYPGKGVITFDAKNCYGAR
jgi:hypothetical protein